MKKLGFARTSSCFLAAGLWLATSASFQPQTDSASAREQPVPEPKNMATLELTPEAPKVEVIDLTVKNLPEPTETNTWVVSTQTTDGFRPGSIDPTNAAAGARSQQWTLAEVFVENSEVTESGYVEYTLRASLRGDGARVTTTEVIAAARAVSPEVSVVAEALHFTTKPGDDLDSLSRDAIRVRVKGGLTFEPGMLRWTFISTSVPSDPEAHAAFDAALPVATDTGELDRFLLPERQLQP